MELTKRKNRIAKSDIYFMSSTTKKFLQKICSKETASVDMTQYGFMRDSKVFRVKLQIQPLFFQLQKICDKSQLSISAKRLNKRVRLANRKMTPQMQKQRNIMKKKPHGLRNHQ